MRIDTLIVRNFRGFAHREFHFHPEFNLVVGENASGKSSLLEALSIAASAWTLGIRDVDGREIRRRDVRLVGRATDSESFWEPQLPSSVEAHGVVQDAGVRWARSRASLQGRTSHAEAAALKSIASEAEAAVAAGGEVVLPLLGYYPTGRLWNIADAQMKVHLDEPGDRATKSRLSAYRASFDARISVSELVRWIGRQAWIGFQRRGRMSRPYEAVVDALVRNVYGAQALGFDAKLGEIVVTMDDGSEHPFSNLSDGQRSMLALVGDLARRAATLNPHLGDAVLQSTPGVVLIDELDLHLHPKWQRHVIENLRSTFPRVQFVCSSHSPFLIQSLRAGEELLMLDGEPLSNLAHLSLERIAEAIQRVPHAAVSARYADMRGAAERYLDVVSRITGPPSPEVERELAELLVPLASNPAFQAVLEFERAAKQASHRDETRS